MSYDHFVALSGQHPDMYDADSAALHYHRLAATGAKEDADSLRGKWTEARLAKQEIDTPESRLAATVSVPVFDPERLPRYSFYVQFPFRLTKSYISRDEQGFCIIDNPVRRDRVFRLPFVAPSSWKGSLRAALWKLGHDEADSAVLRLFGNRKGEDESFRAGRLRFFPTFFDQHSLEMINPHDRVRRVGKNPILFESVPSGTPGAFSLLYLPFDRIGGDEPETRQQVRQDLTLVAAGLQAMFCTYGFGAKTSSGYGAAVDRFCDTKTRRRENLPDGIALLKAILDEPPSLLSFRDQHAPLREFSEEEWQELLGDDIGAYHAALEARERHAQNVRAGQVSQGIDSFGEMASVLTTWAQELRREAPDA